MQRSRALVLTCTVITILPPIAVWILIASTAVNVPYWDEWEWAALIYKFHLGTLTFADLWSQHNEHRLLFPQLILLGLDRFGGWSPVREQFVSLFFLISTQIGLFVIIRRTIHGTAALVIGVFVSALLYGLWQAENFTWGFQMGWFLCNAGCVVVIALLTRPNRRMLDAAASMAIAVIASFSLSQGLLAWLVGAIAIVMVQRAIFPLLAVWSVAAGVTYATYRYGLGEPAGLTHFNILAHPLSAVHYALAYLGAPIFGGSGVMPSTLAGFVVSLVVLGAFIADVSGADRRRHFLRRGPWYALAAFPLACALATAVGRATFGASQALSSRYTTVSGLIWIAATCICGTYLAQSPARTRALWQTNLPVIAATLFAVALYQSNINGWGEWMSTESSWASARHGLEANDPAALGKLYPAAARIELLIDELRHVHDGPFRNG